MNQELHFYVDVRAEFQRPDSIDEPTGEELGAILAADLPAHGIRVVKIEGIDFAHHLHCSVGDSVIELVVGADLLDDSDDRWFIQLCIERSFFGRNTASDANYRRLLVAVSVVLREYDRIFDIRWFPDFDIPEYLALMPHAASPIRAENYAENLHPLIAYYWQLNRITDVIVSPITIVLFFVFSAVISAVSPAIGPVVVSILFFGVLATITVVPFVLSVFVAREAKRKTHLNG